MMPIISRFYGLIVKMYFMQSEHNPPHIHAIYENEYIGDMGNSKFCKAAAA